MPRKTKAKGKNKVALNLAARQKDYQETVDHLKGNKVAAGFHKPGNGKRGSH